MAVLCSSAAKYEHVCVAPADARSESFAGGGSIA